MAKAKVKVTVKPVKKGSGTLIASVPISVEKNTNPNGKRMFETKAQITLRTETTKYGKPRRKRQKAN